MVDVGVVHDAKGDGVIGIGIGVVASAGAAAVLVVHVEVHAMMWGLRLRMKAEGRYGATGSRVRT